MEYKALEADILQLVSGASEENLRVFGTETVVRLVQDDVQLGLVSKRDLDDDALLALTSARHRILTASSAELRGHLARINKGILTDGDMDFPLLNILDALERWTTFLETGRRGELYELAIRSIEQVDFQVEADLNDVLATPEMAAEYERIRRLLAG